MTPQRVTLTTLGDNSPIRSREFYKSMGWKESRQSEENIAFFQTNGMMLGLFELNFLAEDRGREGKSLGTDAIALCQNFATPKDVDEHLKKLSNVGRRYSRSPKTCFGEAIRDITQTQTNMHGRSRPTRSGRLRRMVRCVFQTDGSLQFIKRFYFLASLCEMLNSAHYSAATLRDARICLKYWPVWLFSLPATSSGVPGAITSPPLSPP